MTRLKDACDDYKISADKCKSEFNHNKIKSWEDVELYKNEVLPYLELDLISMKELFITMNKEIYGLIGTNITNYLTVPAMAYDHWTSTIFEYNNKCDKNNRITVKISEDEKINLSEVQYMVVE